MGKRTRLPVVFVGRRPRATAYRCPCHPIRSYRTDSRERLPSTDRGESSHPLRSRRMSVTVDRQPLPAAEMGLETLGQLIAHLQKDNRLVVHVLVDGQEPDLSHMGTVRKIPLSQHTLFVETADPTQLAIQA